MSFAGLWFSILAWFCSLGAIFFAIGDPPPGPEYEAAIAFKQQAVGITFTMSIFCLVLSVLFAIWGRKKRPVVSGIAIFLVSLWLLVVIYTIISV